MPLLVPAAVSVFVPPPISDEPAWFIRLEVLPPPALVPGLAPPRVLSALLHPLSAIDSASTVVNANFFMCSSPFTGKSGQLPRS